VTLPGQRRCRVAFALASAALGLSACASDPWPGVVEGVTDDAVCTRQFDASPQPGGYTPCVPNEAVEAEVTQIEVGDCVELNIHHPSLVIEREVPCPDTEPYFPRVETTVPE